ncbi:MAG: immune inhibitor A [Anaerolineae bacterium]|nr:immune inhibitor A [Anaerolineae bacterium]
MAPPVPTPTPALTHTPRPTATRTPTPTPTPTPMPTVAPTNADLLLIDPAPRPFDYIVVNPAPPRRVPNATRTFWVVDGATRERREIPARLRVQTEHIAMWVEEGVWHDVRLLEEAAAFLETQVYPTTRAAFGSEWTPGVDNDPHVHILHATGLGDGVIGYTSSADEYPRALYPFSNEAEMITIHIDTVAVGSTTYYASLARELQRLIQWYQDRNEDRWIREGSAELAVRLNGLDAGQPGTAYLVRPDTSLTAWDEADRAPHRGAAALFVTYFHERYGDAGTRALAAQSLNGAAGFDAALAEIGAGRTFEPFFAEWLAANYLDRVPGGDARYSYTTLDVPQPALAAAYESYPVAEELAVQQFGADYILLRGDSDLRIRFSGATATPLLNLAPHSGRTLWWSNRADASLTTLARGFDLSGVASATLTYWAWYDLEEGYDYVTVEVSADGESWQQLRPPSGTDANPRGNNPGWGYTGSSGGWIQEAVDLSPYAGGVVLVRFAYLTDGAVTGAGFALDDVAIPEIGYADDVESGDGGWQTTGFVRTNDLVPQRYMVLLIGLGDTVSLQRLPVQDDQTGEWTVLLGRAEVREAVLVVSGLAPLTTHPAPYRLEIEAK